MMILRQRLIDLGITGYVEQQQIIQEVAWWLQDHKKDIGNQIYSDHRVVAEAVFDVLLLNCEREQVKT